MLCFNVVNCESIVLKTSSHFEFPIFFHADVLVYFSVDYTKVNCSHIDQLKGR